jgi:hypothetical protein
MDVMPEDVEVLVNELMLLQSDLQRNSLTRRQHTRCGVLCAECRQAREAEDAALDRWSVVSARLAELAPEHGLPLL